MGEQQHPDHPHEGGPPGQDPDFVPPGHGGTPPGQDKPDDEEENGEGEPTHPVVIPGEPTHPIAAPPGTPSHPIETPPAGPSHPIEQPPPAGPEQHDEDEDEEKQPA